MGPRKTTSPGTIRAGIGGWTFESWRGAFYPNGLPQAQELHFASRALPTIEVNARGGTGPDEARTARQASHSRTAAAPSRRRRLELFMHWATTGELKNKHGQRAGTGRCR